MVTPASPFPIGDPAGMACALIPAQHLGAGILTVSLGIAAGLLGLWWLREHWSARDRRAMRRIHRLGEQIASDRSGQEILRRLRAVLPEVLRVSDVHLYLLNRATRTLCEVTEDSSVSGRTIPLEQTNGALERALAACFRNRSLLTIPDMRRSFLIAGSPQERLPRSAMFVPMFAQADLAGVLAVFHASRPTNLNTDERAVLQHLANQIAINLRLREQQTRQEQIFRSENLAATNQLISTVVAELKAPLNDIEGRGHALLGGSSEIEPEVQRIVAGVRNAKSIVRRLLSIVRPDPQEGDQVEVTGLLWEVAGERAQSLEQHEVQVQYDVPPDLLSTGGRRSQLREVLLGLLAYAENKAASAAKRISVRARLLAGTVRIEIGFSGNETSGDPFSEGSEVPAGVPGPAVCRGILSNEGGELRHLYTPDGDQRFDIILPATRPAAGLAKERATHDDSARAFTALVAEPEVASRGRLTALLADTGHRCVSVASGEEAVDLSQRLSFDVVFCPARLPGMNCFELFERLREHVPACVLLSEGPDSELLNSLPEEAFHLLHKPVEEQHLRRVLASIESDSPTPTR